MSTFSFGSVSPISFRNPFWLLESGSVSCVAPAGFELGILLPQLLRAGITGMCCHTWLHKSLFILLEMIQLLSVACSPITLADPGGPEQQSFREVPTPGTLCAPSLLPTSYTSFVST
jgi:hypothetical protein